MSALISSEVILWSLGRLIASWVTSKMIWLMAMTVSASSDPAGSEGVGKATAPGAVGDPEAPVEGEAAGPVSEAEGPSRSPPAGSSPERVSARTPPTRRTTARHTPAMSFFVHFSPAKGLPITEDMVLSAYSPAI